MINTSNSYQSLIYTSGRKFCVEATITFKDGNILKLDDKDIIQGGVIIDDAVSHPNSFEIGSAIIGKLTLILNNLEGDFNNYNFDKAFIFIKIGLILLDSTTEWIPKGYFTVDEAVFSTSTVTITALDNMSKFDRPYKTSTLEYPATLKTILEDACSCCNTLFLEQDFLNSGYMVASRPTDDKITFREIISWIAQLSGSFAKINHNGELFLSWYNFENFKEEKKFADLVHNKSYDIATENIEITGIQIVPIDEEKQTYLSGAEGYVISIEENPLAQDDIERLASQIAQKLIGFSFRPFTAESLSNPAVEAGDVAMITDRKGNEYKTILSTISFTIGSFETYTADAESKNSKESTRYKASTKTVQAVKTEVEKQISIYDLSTQQLSSLLTNSMGLFQTVEKQDDGSIICYAHDKPTLAESEIIWKKTREAFGVSYDGGKTWSGMTAEGNAVAKVLNTIGINADWINAGEIKAENISNEYKQSVTDEIKSSSNQVTQAFQVADGELLSKISQTFTSTDEFKSYQETISTQMKQTASDWTFQFTNLTQEFNNFSSETQENFNEIVKYIRFVDGNIILGMIGNSSSLKISNNRISFMEGESEVAYMSNGKLYITDGEFLNSLQLGNFTFEPRSNGNLSFYKNRK